LLGRAIPQSVAEEYASAFLPAVPRVTQASQFKRDPGIVKGPLSGGMERASTSRETMTLQSEEANAWKEDTKEAAQLRRPLCSETWKFDPTHILLIIS
jgi:hypothetical protein